MEEVKNRFGGGGYNQAQRFQLNAQDAGVKKSSALNLLGVDAQIVDAYEALMNMIKTHPIGGMDQLMIDYKPYREHPKGTTRKEQKLYKKEMFAVMYSTLMVNQSADIYRLNNVILGAGLEALITLLPRSGATAKSSVELKKYNYAKYKYLKKKAYPQCIGLSGFSPAMKQKLITQIQNQNLQGFAGQANGYTTTQMLHSLASVGQHFTNAEAVPELQFNEDAVLGLLARLLLRVPVFAGGETKQVSISQYINQNAQYQVSFGAIMVSDLVGLNTHHSQTVTSWTERGYTMDFLKWSYSIKNYGADAMYVGWVNEDEGETTSFVVGIPQGFSYTFPKWALRMNSSIFIVTLDAKVSADPHSFGHYKSLYQADFNFVAAHWMHLQDQADFHAYDASAKLQKPSNDQMYYQKSKVLMGCLKSKNAKISVLGNQKLESSGMITFGQTSLAQGLNDFSYGMGDVTQLFSRFNSSIEVGQKVYWLGKIATWVATNLEKVKAYTREQQVEMQRMIKAVLPLDASDEVLSGLARQGVTASQLQILYDVAGVESPFGLEGGQLNLLQKRKRVFQ